MAAKLATQTFNAVGLAALKVAIDAWLAGGQVVACQWISDAGTDSIIFYYI
jgi:hypothetical protein